MAKRVLQLSKIRLDGNTQPRVELEESLIAEYKEAYLAGVTMPPLEVMFDGASYWLWDGFHRRWGAERAGLEKLPCNVTNGTREDAQWASYGANVTHGLRRTNSDKAKAIRAALKHPNAKSDDLVAEHVGVHRNTVLKYRQEMTSTNCASREGRDGRTINTANIGKSKPPPEPVDDEPDEPDEPDEKETEDFDDEPVEDEQPEADDNADLRQEFTRRLSDWIDEQSDDLGIAYGVLAEWIRAAL
jgi:ParB-like chromosome segregation protein Spo0J